MFTDRVASPIDLTIRYRRLDDLRAALPADEGEWLTPAERRELARYRAPSRRDAWLCGRALAKQVIADVSGSEPAEIEILSRDAEGSAVAPSLRIAGRLMPWRLSISHSDRGVLVSLSVDPNLRVGVDLASREEADPAALGFWFTEAEREAGCLSDPRQAATCWAIKEAAYKALNDGEPFVPHRYEVVRLDDGYGVRCDDADELIPVEIWDIDGHVAALVVMPDRHSTPGRDRAPAMSA